ncbi:MAG TPA: DUF4292 domain-containing protein [Edaphocola sp.]|nr:DUF4292 domain-containing protein [Edaphocola sp.]
MNNNIAFKGIGIFVIIGLLLTLNSCSGTKKVTKKDATVEVVKPVTPDFNKLYQQIFTYNTFNCSKVKLNYKSSSQSQSINANLKMQKGEKIWASLVAMGIAEVARALITPERLAAVERLSKSSYDMSFEEGIAKLNAPITFPMLENLIIGNPIMGELKIESSKVENEEIILTMNKDGFTQKLVYDLKEQTLKQQTLSSEIKKINITADYDKYIVIGGQRFSTIRKIELDDQKNNRKVTLSVDFTNPELDKPLEFSFSIPSSYKAKKL